jgi:hypothetical protein
VSSGRQLKEAPNQGSPYSRGLHSRGPPLKVAPTQGILHSRWPPLKVAPTLQAPIRGDQLRGPPLKDHTLEGAPTKASSHSKNPPFLCGRPPRGGPLCKCKNPLKGALLKGALPSRGPPPNALKPLSPLVVVCLCTGPFICGGPQFCGGPVPQHMWHVPKFGPGAPRGSNTLTLKRL